MPAGVANPGSSLSATQLQQAAAESKDASVEVSEDMLRDALVTLGCQVPSVLNSSAVSELLAGDKLPASASTPWKQLSEAERDAWVKLGCDTQGHMHTERRLQHVLRDCNMTVGLSLIHI